MNSFSARLKSFLITFRWIIIPGVPLAFFIFMMILLFSPNNTRTPQIVPPNNTTTPQPSTFPPINHNHDFITEQDKSPVDSRPGLQKKELLPDNTIVYTFTSPVANRPNIIITSGQNNILFRRTVTDPALPIKISDYTDSNGQPKFVFKGSNFYGIQAQTYIYAELGIAFIADPQTSKVFEQHTFTPMRVEEYVKKYGDDIQSYP